MSQKKSKTKKHTKKEQRQRDGESDEELERDGGKEERERWTEHKTSGETLLEALTVDCHIKNQGYIRCEHTDPCHPSFTLLPEMTQNCQGTSACAQWNI